MPKALVFFVVLSVGFAVRAEPCSVVGIPTPTELVQRAEIILTARAERVSEAPGERGALAESATQVIFTVLEVVKGTLPDPELRFNGHLGGEDDPNDRSIPRDFVRPGGRSGNCFALGYRSGGEYLLFLARSQHKAYAQPFNLTPYWAPLAATNDQLFGPDDPWLVWVRRAVAEQRARPRPGA